MAKNENSNFSYMTRRIDGTTYKVKVIFSDTAYSARTAHPFQRNGAPFRFKLSKAQQVD